MPLTLYIHLLHYVVGALPLFTGRICSEEANCRSAGIKFTQRPKISIFSLQGNCTNSREIWHGRVAGPCEISCQSVQGGGYVANKSGKFPLFVKDLPRRGEPFDRFLRVLRA